MQMTIKPMRKDGKFPVTFSYSGGPNGFGGMNYGKSFNKLYTVDKVKAVLSTLGADDLLIDRSGQNLKQFVEA